MVAEDVSFAPGIKNGKDYLLNALPILKRQGYQTFSEIKPAELDGVTFYREDLIRHISQGITVYQTQFSTVMRGYALVIGITTEYADETEKLARGLSLHFAQRGGTLAESTSSQNEPAKLNPQEAGSMQGEPYRNSYFGLTYHLPDGWYVDTRIFRERLKESTGEASGTTRKNFVLLSANEFAPGTPRVGFNPVIVLMVDNSSAYHPPLTARDYLPKITASFHAQNAELYSKERNLMSGPISFTVRITSGPTGTRPSYALTGKVMFLRGRSSPRQCRN